MHLRAIASWLGVRTDDTAVDAMKHPENSPYAFLGPRGARFGNDRFFLDQPALRARRASVQNLDAPLDWGNGARALTPEVKALATEFGYG
jgi:hypothetical protein